MDKRASEVISGIKKLGWSKIKLTKKGYRGAVQTYKTRKGTLVAVMFYMQEAFVVEDSQGLFGVQDLEYGLMDEKGIDLEGTGHINGLTLLAYTEENEVRFNERELERLDIHSDLIKSDLERRLRAVAQLGEMEEIEL